VGLDIRLPIGGMFTVAGLLLAIYGLATGGDERLYERALGVNVNLWWGLVMLVFGVVMLLLGRRGGRVQGERPTSESAEGRATEAREHTTGLEREK